MDQFAVMIVFREQKLSVESSCSYHIHNGIYNTESEENHGEYDPGDIVHSLGFPLPATKPSVVHRPILKCQKSNLKKSSITSVLTPYLHLHCKNKKRKYHIR